MKGINPTSLLAYDNTAATAKALPGDWSVVRGPKGVGGAPWRVANTLTYYRCADHTTLYKTDLPSLCFSARDGLYITLTLTMTITLTLHRTL